MKIEGDNDEYMNRRVWMMNLVNGMRILSLMNGLIDELRGQKLDEIMNLVNDGD